MAKKNKNIFRRILRFIKFAAIIFFASSILSIVIFRWVNPPVTPLMLIRSIQQKFDGKEMKLKKQWVNYDKISPNIVQALVTSEDQKFKDHFGFDFKAIEKVQELNEKENEVKKGGSTISQQTAKNVFLWPNRDWIRKGFETYFTFLMEVFWSKKRIMEVYLNIIEMGDGIYGIEAASQEYYKKSADKLTKREAASIAAIVPAPRKWSPIAPSPRVKHKIQWILAKMPAIGNVEL